jgi:hypothetical protein
MSGKDWTLAGHADDAAFKPLDRAAAAKADAHFSDNYVRLPGAPVPISRTLSRKLGYDVDRVNYTAGDDARGDPAGEAGDD